MSARLRIALAQINPTVGDLSGNAEKIIRFQRHASRLGADLTVFPECALPGYPPEDLLLRRSFVDANLRALESCARRIENGAALIGCIDSRHGRLFNAAAWIAGGKVRGVYHKQALPNYGVFDEKRYFHPGAPGGRFRLGAVPIAVSICEDIWENGDSNPVLAQAKKGAALLINLSASPYYAGKFGERLSLLRRRVKQTRLPILYVNMAGGHDELIFDGRSLLLDARGRLDVLAEPFKEDLRIGEFSADSRGRLRPETRSLSPRPDAVDEIHRALLLGLHDYVEKNGFKKVVVGLSGGIDSALTAALAVQALGKERVIGVGMPSRFSSPGTRADAARLASNLGIAYRIIPIEGIFRATLAALAPVFKGLPADTTEENLQSRIRGALLMALSNKLGALVLTTGNKSEVSVGYCTLYGDTAGGFSVLKDVPKGLVYRLSRFINARAGRDLIPESTIRRAPTAELKARQTDQDTLPPYPLLDKIIRLYVEQDRGCSEIAQQGVPGALLRKVIRMIDANEYKRRQSPPGIKITPKSFGKDRRMPITNKFRED